MSLLYQNNSAALKSRSVFVLSRAQTGVAVRWVRLYHHAKRDLETQWSDNSFKLAFVSM